MNKVSIVIPVYINKPSLFAMTVNCLHDIIMTIGPKIEIIVVDDGSKYDVSKLKKLFPDIKLIQSLKNQGYAKSVNIGIISSNYENILLLNNDIRITNLRWLEIMLNELRESNLDITAPAGGRMTKNWEYIQGEVLKKGEEFTYLPGWCLLVKKSVFSKIGLISENFGHGYFEDVLFCYKAKKAGCRLGITENPGVEHLYHATFKAEGYDLAKEYKEKRLKFLELIGEK